MEFSINRRKTFLNGIQNIYCVYSLGHMSIYNSQISTVFWRRIWWWCAKWLETRAHHHHRDCSLWFFVWLACNSRWHSAHYTFFIFYIGRRRQYKRKIFLNYCLPQHFIQVVVIFWDELIEFFFYFFFFSLPTGVNSCPISAWWPNDFPLNSSTEYIEAHLD